MTYPWGTANTAGGTGALLEVVRASRPCWALHGRGTPMLLKGQGFVRAPTGPLLASLHELRASAVTEARDRCHSDEEQRGAKADAY
jgi:hypothetical protein